MSSSELIRNMNGQKLNYLSSTIKGQNTFDYQNNVSYIHFFKYLEHALYYMKKMHNPVIAKVVLPDDIPFSLEYGFYGDVDTYYDDSLMGWYVPLPEYVIERSLFQKDFIVDFTHDGVWQDPLRKKDYSYGADVFWTEQTIKKGLKKEIVKQRWNEEDIYYEYLKKVMSECNYYTDKITRYLKTINLEEELQKTKEYIIENQVITRRRHPRCR